MKFLILKLLPQNTIFEIPVRKQERFFVFFNIHYTQNKVEWTREFGLKNNKYQLYKQYFMTLKISINRNVKTHDEILEII
jgi:hypothetical protein